MSVTEPVVAPPASRARGVGRFTVQTWFQLVLAVMAIVVLIGAAAGAQVIANTNDATDRVMNHTQPALTRAYQLQSALLNQETGVRGYTISGDRQFLDPYVEGQRAQTEAANRIAVLLDGNIALLADLAAVQSASEKWRAGYADARIAEQVPSAAASTAVSTQGKTLFDDVRTAFVTQNANLTATILADRAALDQARTLRNVVLVGMLVAFLLTGAILTFLARRLVARPISELTAASLRVANGDFDHHIEVTGPADVATVAEAVESMRRRVVAELTTSRAQEAVLTRQKAELDLQTEELRRSNTELEQFAYVASHDLQEPLRKVASFCQLLDKRYGDQLDARGKQYIDYAVDGAKRMQVLINDLLTFSRVGRFTEGAARVDLRASLDAALTNISSVVEDTGTRLELPDRLPEVVGDPTLLTMLWQNLLSNAVKFRTPDVAPLIRIEAAPDPDTGLWEFSVADNGIGIAPEFAEKVFVIFQRLHNRGEYSGTGIGLAICRKIVEYHGGTIRIDTEYTGGTCFRFTLPPAPENETDHVSEAAGAAAE